MPAVTIITVIVTVVVVVVIVIVVVVIIVTSSLHMPLLLGVCFYDVIEGKSWRDNVGHVIPGVVGVVVRSGGLIY